MEETGLQDMAGIENVVEEEFTEKLEGYKGKWRNLNFLYNGETFIGCYDYNTEELAHTGYKEAMKKYDFLIFKCGTKRCVEEISYSIPIPVID